MKRKFIISGGGTGGHIFPAISIADVIRKRFPDASILFVGAEKRMEMKRVPEAGYKIVGLPVVGLNRKNPFKNIPVLFKLFKSMNKAKSIIKNFQPDIAIGVGGYASGPLLKAANRKKIPTLLQEQNSYAGVTNKLLAKKAATICVAYDKMDQFFPSEKIVLTGNPVRQDLICTPEKRKEAIDFFGLDEEKKTILVVGGSLGARTLNYSMIYSLPLISKSDVQFIWQSGKYYYQSCYSELVLHKGAPVVLRKFIHRMDLAYSAADLIISRAGAGSISEFSIIGKPVILVPSPNVAEDHQMKNALSLVNKNAAILIQDNKAKADLIKTALNLIQDDKTQEELSRNIRRLAMPDAADKIVDEIEKLINANN